MAKLQIPSQGATGNGVPIRVSIPASVAFNPDALKESIGSLMGKLGCGACFSGFDCRLLLQRDYIINSAKKAEPVQSLAENRLPVLSVRVDKVTSYDLVKVKSVIDKIHKKFGCSPCHSGFDIAFLNEVSSPTVRELVGG